MLPQQIILVREIGDIGHPYWTASSLDGLHLVLEPGEAVLHVGNYRISQIIPRAWVMPDTTAVVVTDRRIGFLTTRFDKGGGWVGLGIAGLAVAATANAVSKRRAAERSAGRVAVGQVRHEWITEISLRRKKALIGVVDTYVDITLASSAGPRVIEIWCRGLSDGQFIRWLVDVVSAHRMTLLTPGSADITALQRYQNGSHDAARASKPNDPRWLLPGNSAELIDLVITRQFPPPRIS